jgi:opacity protein-like surface antigen
VDLLVLNGSVIYQWETTRVRPFLTAGIGAYRYDFQGGGSAIKFGVSFGGGVNIPVASRLDIKLEASLHGTNAPDPDSFIFLTAGVRYRF